MGREVWANDCAGQLAVVAYSDKVAHCFRETVGTAAATQLTLLQREMGWALRLGSVL